MNPFKKAWSGPAASVVGFALLMAVSVAVHAQEPNANVRAARLSDVEGDVQLTQGSQIIANPALVNTPLFEGVLITTRDDGRAELQFDDGSVARISPNSSLKIAALRQDGNSIHAELNLQSGLAYFEFQGDGASRTLARFGDSTVTASGFTVLRINLDNPPGEVAVFSGNAHLQSGTALSLDLRGGESVALNASDPSVYNLAETIEPDSWDAWNADRDQELTSQQAAKTEASSNTSNSNNPAWGDLDANGNWYNVPGQGYVWSPNEAASGNWEPYGCGNWVWTPQFGYVWVGCEQWGYLPYSSGYWNYYDGFGWGWAPGYGYPWWQTGNWICNVGIRPHRFEPPHRPHGGPVRPPNEPIHRGGFYQPNPVVSVNRGPSSPVGNPVHVIGRPVTIAGNTVTPLKPLMPRPVYGPPPSSGFNRTNPVYGVNSGAANQGSVNHGYGVNQGYGVNRGTGNTAPTTGYIPWANSPTNHTGAWTAPVAPNTGYHPPVTSRGYSGPSAPPASHVYSGGSPAPRASGGGGGGGGGHVSSGGGGGGGHVSGGGGAPAASGGHH